MPDLNPLTRQRIVELAQQLQSLGHGKRRPAVEALASELGWSANRVYRALKSVGWTSGRKKRADCGNTKQDEDVLVEMTAMMATSKRANGKVLMEIPNARSVLATNGRDFKVSNSRLSTLLRNRTMHAKAIKRDSANTSMRSLHPNHVHQVDPSYCVLYYLPGSKGQSKQQWASEDELYKNKPQNFEKLAKFRVWRYVLTDHYSSTIVVRYYQSAGESSRNLYDFLLYCWQRMEGRPFHGVPKMLVWDKGSANTSGVIKNALASLSVETYDHAKGNARAKGQVEKSNDLVERLFESRLKYEPLNSVEELNEAAERWSIAYNADGIPEYDSRLHRRSMIEPLARYEIWQTIRQEQLRLLPSRDICEALLSAEPQTRKVSQALTITFSHPMVKRSLTYDLKDFPLAHPGATVDVSWMVYGDNLVRISAQDYKGETQSMIVEPVAFDDFSGFRVEGPVFGETYESMPDTIIDKNKKAADRAAYPEANNQEEIDKAKKKGATPFGGLDAHSHLANVYIPDYMNRPGTNISVPDSNTIPEKPMTHIEVCRELVGMLSRSLTPEENNWIRQAYPDGVKNEDFDELAAKLRERTDKESSETRNLQLVK